MEAKTQVAPAPPRRLLTYGHQSIDEDDIRTVAEILRGDWLTQGPAIELFEAALRQYFGAQHAVVCANGTAALHLVASALDWKPGDVVIVPAITFLASSNCCLYVGAEPVFVDIDPDTLTIDPARVEEKVARLTAQGRRVRAIMGVDLAGHPCDWPALQSIAKRYGATLVDDACHAIGALCHGSKLGSGVHADVTVLSFHPVKHVTTGEGGALLTDDGELAQRLRRLRSHGTVRNPDAPDWEGPWYSDMVDLGYNYRLTDFQCGLGISQLRKVEHFLARRREIANFYDQAFAGSKWFRTPTTMPWARHAYHLYVLRAQFGRGMPDRRAFFAACLSRGIQLQVHYRPVMLNSYYRTRFPYDPAEFTTSLAYYSETLSIPMYPSLERADLEYVVETLEECAAD